VFLSTFFFLGGGGHLGLWRGFWYTICPAFWRNEERSWKLKSAVRTVFPQDAVKTSAQVWSTINRLSPSPGLFKREWFWTAKIDERYDILRGFTSNYQFYKGRPTSVQKSPMTSLKRCFHDDQELWKKAREGAFAKSASRNFQQQRLENCSKNGGRNRKSLQINIASKLGIHRWCSNDVECPLITYLWGKNQ